MTLRAVIVDDEPIARRRLKTLLKGEPGVEVIAECEDGGQAVDAIRRLRPDLIFLDVQMPGLDGFDVVEALEPGEHPAVIFVTAYDHYAVRAFDVHAADYLLKPFERARLRQALAHVASLAADRDAAPRLRALVETIRASQPVRRLAVRTAGRVYAVKVEEIDWIEAAGHYLEVHTAAASHLLRESIGGIERRLDTAQFVRIHRSAIVNVDRIRELQPSFHGECVVVLKSGARLRCSRTYAGRLAKALGS